jgi:type II secretory ATPase GspE/PulE/Tfp pilus assembly ATPase PilB-like protein
MNDIALSGQAKQMVLARLLTDTSARNRLAGRCSTKSSPKERIGIFTIYEPVGCEHCNDLRTAGLLKTMQGITSLEEINRVTKD